MENDLDFEHLENVYNVYFNYSMILMFFGYANNPLLYCMQMAEDSSLF